MLKITKIRAGAVPYFSKFSRASPRARRSIGKNQSGLIIFREIHRKVVNRIFRQIKGE